MQPVVKAYPNRVSWVLAGNALSDKYFLWLVVALLGLSAKIACAATITYSATLDGASESPSNASPGTGTATVTFDTVLHTMSVQSNFSGLLGTVTAAHIHCCTATPGVGLAGVATTTPTFTGFPLGVTAGKLECPVRHQQRRNTGKRRVGFPFRDRQRRSVFQYPHGTIPGRRDSRFPCTGTGSRTRNPDLDCHQPSWLRRIATRKAGLNNG